MHLRMHATHMYLTEWRTECPARNLEPSALEVRTLNLIGRQIARSRERLRRFRATVQPTQQLAARRVQQVVPIQLTARDDPFDDRQRRRRPVRLRHRDRPIELDDGARYQLDQSVVERDDARPVRLISRRGGRMNRCDGSLYLIRAGGT